VFTTWGRPICLTTSGAAVGADDAARGVRPRSKVVDATRPMFYVHWRLDAGTTDGLPDQHPARAVLRRDGTV